MIKIRKYSFIRILEMIFMIAVVLSTGSLISTDFPVFKYICVPIWGVIILCRGKRIFLNYLQAIIVVSVVIILLLSNRTTISTAFGSVMNEVLRLFILFSIVSGKKELEEDMNFILKFLFFLSLISNLLFLVHLAGVDLRFITSNKISKGTVFYLQTPYYNSEMTVFNWRNAGFCWEPGVYQIYLNFLLLFAIYDTKLRRSRKIIRVLYLCFFIYTVGSITGFAICALIVTIYVFQTQKKQWLALFPLAVLAMVVIIPVGINMWTEKTKTLSYFYRTNDISIGLSVVKKHWLLGYGINTTAFADEYQSVMGMMRGNTNGIIQILLSVGGLGFFVYTILYIEYTKWLKRHYSRFMCIPAVVWCFISLNNEPIGTSVFMYYLLCIGLASILRQRISEHDSYFGIRGGRKYSEI